MADWRIADWSALLWPFRDLGPPRGPLSRADSESAQKAHRTHPLGASGTTFEAVPGPAQFQ
eukprot:9672732-Alexandrium_andersonii.AAC.1